MHQLLTLFSEEFIFPISAFKSLLFQKRFVSSANRIVSNKGQWVAKSFMYSRKSTGPKIEPWGTPLYTDCILTIY